MRLEDLTPGATVRGILPDAGVSVVSVQWHGSDTVTLVYRSSAGRVADEIIEQGRPWSFDGDGALFRLVAEAHRIRLAYLFDPVLAVHTSGSTSSPAMWTSRRSSLRRIIATT